MKVTKKIKLKRLIKIRIKIKIKIKIEALKKRWKIKLKMREEGPTWNKKKKRYFKILLCRNFVRKVRDYSGLDDTCQWCLRSKIGVWQMPLFKFLRLKIWRWNLRLDWSKRLKYKVHHFWPKMLMNACDAITNARRRGHFDWDEKPQWDTCIRWERGSDSARG